MFGTIVCGVDDSPAARGALRVAVGLARSLDAALVLEHAVEQLHAPGTSAAPGAAQRLRREQQAEAEELVAQLAREAGAPESVELHVGPGKPAERLARLAEAYERPLLVVGSRGRGAARSALLGSTSSALAARAPCPVLVVPAAAADAPA